MAKKKINDDTLLQLIPDGNSPAEAARRLDWNHGTRACSIARISLKYGSRVSEGSPQFFYFRFPGGPSPRCRSSPSCSS